LQSSLPTREAQQAQTGAARHACLIAWIALQVLRISAQSVLRDAAVRQNLRLQVLRTSGGEFDQGSVTKGSGHWTSSAGCQSTCMRPLCLHAPAVSAGGSSQASRNRICALFSGSGQLAAVRSAIVYCCFKEDANQLARLLSTRGVSARAYHAGKDYRVRQHSLHSQEQYCQGKQWQGGWTSHAPVLYC
jgi:superfamily II DNA helicase RecQ